MDARRKSRSKSSLKSAGRPPLPPSANRVWSKRPYVQRATDMAGASSSKADTAPPPPSAATDGGDGSHKLASCESGWEGRSRSHDLSIPPESLKRMISNRISARKTRNKKFEHTLELEIEAKTLEDQIMEELKPQIEWYTREKRLLQIERNGLMARINFYANQEIIRNVEIEAKKAQVQRLRKFHEQQQINAVWNCEPAFSTEDMLQQQHDQDSDIFSLFFGQSSMNNDNIVTDPDNQGDELDLVMGSSSQNKQDGLEAAERNNDGNSSPCELLDLDELDRLLENPNFCDF